LAGVTKAINTTLVKVANGNVIHSSLEMIQVDWAIQGYMFQSDLKVLPLQHFDMIVGMEWLLRFSPIKVHWVQKWLKIPYGNSHITLQGMLSGVLYCNMVELA
jgi:hypothetical protein